MRTINFYSIAQEGNEGYLYIFDTITSGTPIIAQLDDLEVNTIHVVINSFGGDAVTGMAVHNTLVNHPAQVITYNRGFACSAAAVIFMAGDERYAFQATDFLFHQVETVAAGNADDLEAAAQELRTIMESQTAIYRPGELNISFDELNELLVEGELMTAEQALDIGFVTALIREPASQRVSQGVRKVIFQRLHALPAVAQCEPTELEKAEEKQEEQHKVEEQPTQQKKFFGFVKETK